MNTYKKINDTVDEHIFLFCSNIVETNPEIQIENLLKIWCEIQDKNFEETFDPYIKLANKQKKVSSKNVQNIDEIKIDNKEFDDSSNITKFSDSDVEDFSSNTEQNVSNKITEKNKKKQCSYIFQKGPKVGQKCSSNAKQSLDFCGKHNK